MTPIVDLDVYTAGMKKGIQDKLWFMDNLMAKLIQFMTTDVQMVHF